MNVFYNTIVFVRDLKASTEFYTKVLGLGVETEYDTIVFFENHFVLHDGRDICNTTFGERPERTEWGARNLLIYLETDDLEQAYQTVLQSGARIIHPITTQHWGQNVFRFFDPDGHIVEIGEAMHLEYLKQKERK